MSAKALSPCGTTAAARRHRLHGEQLCAACKEAEKAYKAGRRARKRNAAPRLLATADVASILGVDPRTVRKWADAGKLPPAIRTVGGRRRWRIGEIAAIAAEMAATA